MAGRLLLSSVLLLAVAGGVAAAASLPSVPAVPPVPLPVPVAVPALPVPDPGGMPGNGWEGDPPGAPAFPAAPTLVGPRGDLGGVFVVAGLAGLAGIGVLAMWGSARFRDPEEILGHELRSAIYQHVQRHVGASLKDITDALGLSTTNAVWHLRKLEEAGLVRSGKFNGSKVYYPTSGGVQARNLSIAGAALTSDNARQILAFVAQHPGVHQREVARLLAVNHGTVRWHLKKLRRAELLEERRLGASATYHVSPLGVEALRHFQGRQAPVAVAVGVPAEPVPSSPGA